MEHMAYMKKTLEQDGLVFFVGACKAGQVGFVGSCNVEEIGQGRKTAIVGETSAWSVRLAVFMAFSNQSATSIRLGFPAISEADVLDPVQRRVSSYRPANIGGSLP